MIRFYLIIFANFILKWFGYSFQRATEVNTETWEVTYHPWKLKKLKK
jgi:hypothetical protein